ncbi:hypothetical protein METBIDRAFT_10654 [Metschnikowia bicuspidata var. bicuspidata NRRL YB-4993]|uniref:N-terminal of MaoC-like dehydratase domain-containing protein n=1 Tax=Metschnikowia bicuspidata var. bicuspidata NRRL YB-4993 TaxID=869754 RepID=A0A1A0HL33_9ASCO|nr:hypothetical protein METBIDRAFT_10654 [Metschnikowia bicuspidata var. bicuspidata NRRL YB-4993]OBA24518.1 hypothetical protein METBIDRAFT_10654 [Metschnikowia bicuspidata var. bicuspidata NRRL YB-4993]
MCRIKAQTRRWADIIAPRTWIWEDTYSIGGHNHLNKLLNEVISTRSQVSGPLYGSLFIFNTQSNTQLGLDGYDNYQAPLDVENNELYKRRMWVGGSIEYLKLPPVCGDVVVCEENVSSVRCLGPNAFVNISRNFRKDESMVMKEYRTLLYTNEPFRENASRFSETKGFLHSQNIKFSLSQLMRFNALSYNLHKIHYDAEFCHQEELKGIVVSGPFLVLAMLHFFSSLHPNTTIQDFRYKNSEPCYVDEGLIMGINETSRGYTIQVIGDGRLRCGGSVSIAV